MFDCQLNAHHSRRDIVGELIASKAVTRELGSSALPVAIGRFVDAEFDVARAVFYGRPRSIAAKHRHDADALFQRWVRRAR